MPFSPFSPCFQVGFQVHCCSPQSRDAWKIMTALFILYILSIEFVLFRVDQTGFCPPSSVMLTGSTRCARNSWAFLAEDMSEMGASCFGTNSCCQGCGIAPVSASYLCRRWWCWTRQWKSLQEKAMAGSASWSEAEWTWIKSTGIHSMGTLVTTQRLQFSNRPIFFNQHVPACLLSPDSGLRERSCPINRHPKPLS